MGFLKRLLGQGDGSSPASSSASSTSAAADVDEAERAYELELARAEQDRADDLVRRQQRYAQYAWTPPAQGGERRADDGEADTATDGADRNES
jgi:hypothetical protein